MKTTQKFVIPIELTESFVKPHDRQVTHADFQKWFAEIIFNYHPMNNQIF